MKNKACLKCGLIQMYDEIWGLVFCDANSAFLWGCPDKERVLERYPSAEYEERDDKLNHEFADLAERINLLGECIQDLDSRISYIEGHLVI